MATRRQVHTQAVYREAQQGIPEERTGDLQERLQPSAGHRKPKPLEQTNVLLKVSSHPVVIFNSPKHRCWTTRLVGKRIVEWSCLPKMVKNGQILAAVEMGTRMCGANSNLCSGKLF